MKKKRFERAVDGFFTVAAIVLILVLAYTVALRVLAASEEPEAATPVQEIHPPRPEAGSLVSVESRASLPQPAAPAAPSSEGAENEEAEAKPSESGFDSEKEDGADKYGDFAMLGGSGMESASSDAAVIVREDIPMDKLHQAALVEICREAGVDINLAYGLIMTESSFNPWAVSETGCYGYCQLSCYFPSGLSPVENLRAGIGWLGELIAEHGDVGKALTVYHLGHDDGTRDYANVVLGYARGFGYAG